MLTDTALRNLKPKSKIYKVFDRDGMYVTVSTTGTVTFRYDSSAQSGLVRRRRYDFNEMCNCWAGCGLHKLQKDQYE